MNQPSESDEALTPLPGETPAQTKRRGKEADLAHERHLQGVRVLLPTVIGFGTEAMKVALLLNGGTAGAMLAYIGAGRQDVTPEIITAMWSFGTGLLLASAAHPAAYITQYIYQLYEANKAHILSYPYVEETKRSRRYFKLGIAIHIACASLVMSAIGCAGYGFYNAASSLRPMVAANKAPDMSTATPGLR